MNAPNVPSVVFWLRTEVRGPDECWPWLGSVSKAGYGTLWVRGKLRKAAHISLELHGRPRPGRSLSLHSCDNPPCVNPAHLRWGSHQDNADDKMKRGRWKSGAESRADFKRTPSLVRTVLRSNETGGELSRRLGISKPVINRIRREHGVSRRGGRPATMTERIWKHMKRQADQDGLVELRQTVAARALGLASSNINVAIRRLVDDGRVERVRQCPRTMVWTYRVT